MSALRLFIVEVGIMSHKTNPVSICPALVRSVVLLAWVLSVAPACSREKDLLSWQDDFQSRLEAYAIMQMLNIELLGSPSATRTLEKWCQTHQLAAVASIVAQPILGDNKPTSQEQMQRLEVTGPEQLKYRKVRLYCGDQLLSEADNWYVPGRLTGEMNRLLETTQTPFGEAVAPLEPYRQTISVKMLWSPLPEGWETENPVHGEKNRKQPLTIPDALFEHRAVVYGKDRKPIAEVHEVYQRQILAAPKRNQQ